VINTLVAEVQGVPGDDRCVLLLGYKEELEVMFQKSNKGLARRFQLDGAWTFADFDEGELEAILLSQAKAKGYEVGVDAVEAAMVVLKQQKAKPNFGNGGAVATLLVTAGQRQQERQTKSGLGAAACAADSELVPVDFQGPSAGSKDPFGGLIGIDAVAKKVKRFSAMVKMNKKNGKELLHNLELNFCFVGAPGTGKTTVAQRMGRVFSELGLPIDAEVVECKKDDFTTGFAGQASKKTRETFRRGLGKVLFIDEAYQLNPAPPTLCDKDVTDTICMMLTEDEFKGKMVVILAGYKDDTHALLKSNPGLGSRFSNEIAFPDWGVPEALQMLRLKLGKEDMALHPAAEAQLEALTAKLVQAPDWSSGRDVDTWCTRICQENAVRVDDEEEGGASAGGGAAAAADSRVLLCDLAGSLADLVKQKEERAKAKKPQ
jgi:hypothetical protein